MRGVQSGSTERSSGPQLVAALHDQLARLHLEDRGTRHGLLVITQVTRKRYRPGNVGLLDLQQLERHLQTMADDLVERSLKVDGLSVWCVDFSGPR